MMKSAGYIFVAVLGWNALAVFADVPTSAVPYAGEQRRTVKALSPQQLADLEAGRGMGLSLVAELNRYPGPKHVLELAEALRLTPAQLDRVRNIESAMKKDAQRFGARVIEREARLDALFAGRKAESEETQALIREIGGLQAELRLVHVSAHVATAKLLSAAQIAAYDQQRGYAGGSGPAHRHHH